MVISCNSGNRKIGPVDETRRGKASKVESCEAFVRDKIEARVTLYEIP